MDDRPRAVKGAGQNSAYRSARWHLRAQAFRVSTGIQPVIEPVLCQVDAIRPRFPRLGVALHHVAQIRPNWNKLGGLRVHGGLIWSIDTNPGGDGPVPARVGPFRAAPRASPSRPGRSPGRCMRRRSAAPIRCRPEAPPVADQETCRRHRTLAAHARGRPSSRGGTCSGGAVRLGLSLAARRQTRTAWASAPWTAP